MWMLGAVLGVMALVMTIGGVWAWYVSGRRTEEGADVVHRPRMECVSGGDAADLDARLAACAGDASANAPTRVIAVQLCGTRRVPAARAAVLRAYTSEKFIRPLDGAARN